MKNNLFLLVATIMTGANLSAQDTIPILTVDSTLHVGDSAIFNRNIRVDGSTTLRGEVTAREFIVEENALFKGNVTTLGTIFYPNTPAVSGSFADRDIILRDPVTGAIEKSSLEALRDNIYSKHCEAVGGIVAAPAWTSGTNKLYVACPEVRVGVGIESPTHSLHTAGDVLFQGTARINSGLAVGTEPSGFSRFKVRNPSDPAAIEVDQAGNTTPFNKLIFLQYDQPGTEVLKVVNTATGDVPYLLESDGRITVRHGADKILQLDTTGVLHARTVKVDNHSWPDYVFEPGYDLPPLTEVNSYIHANGHLPEVPSAEETAANGVDVSEMNAILLRKIEELTLYIIGQEERIKKLESAQQQR